MKWKNGRVYEGMWDNNEINGEGEFKWDGKNSYKGMYKGGKREGRGEYKFDGGYYEGMWVNNLPHGEGKLFTGNEEVAGLFRYGRIVKKFGEKETEKVMKNSTIKAKKEEKDDNGRKKKKKKTVKEKKPENPMAVKSGFLEKMGKK